MGFVRFLFFEDVLMQLAIILLHIHSHIALRLLIPLLLLLRTHHFLQSTPSITEDIPETCANILVVRNDLHDGQEQGHSQ